MNECCGNCVFLRRLKVIENNFRNQKILKEGLCCIALASPDGFVLEVVEDDRCEMFEMRWKNARA